MSSVRAAKRYAKAIIDIASDKGVIDVIEKDMSLIITTFESSIDLKTTIFNATINGDVKKNVLLEVFSSVDSITKNVFEVLRQNKRFELLVTIAEQYRLEFESINNMQQVQVTTAFAMTEAIEKQVLAKIATLSDKKIILKNTLDPSIIGGFIIRIGDQQYNASVGQKLRTLSRELSN